MPPSVGDTSVKGDAGLSCGGTATNVGKVASALLAKHVRTLEVLHSLQTSNAQLRREIQDKSGEEEVQRRIAEAVAAAVAAPNDLSEELQAQGEKLRERVAGLEQELISAKQTAEKSLDNANSQMESLRKINVTLQKKCKDLEFEAASHERQISQQGEVESHLRETSVALALAEGRASDLARRLADQELTSSTLQLGLKENDDKICAMKEAETILTAEVEESKTQLARLDAQARDLQERLRVAEAEHGQLGVRLEQALRDLATSREENKEMVKKEQESLARAAEHKSRVNAAEAKLSEERKRFQRFREDAKRKIEEEARRYKAALMEHAYEREQLLVRIDALLREAESMRAHMNNNRSQFSKYVEAKTENTQLKEELDGLRDMVVAVPRPPHRNHSLGSGSSSSILGGDMNKHISVERLRHSISVARGHPTKTNTINNKFTSGNYNVSGGGGGEHVLVRRHSGHGSSSGGSGSGSGSSGWTGTSKAPSYKFAVSPAGSSSGGFSARGDDVDERQRGMRLAQQAF
ncbi:unnamed protein product [Ectocarpus sp. 4 AP-2014]